LFLSTAVILGSCTLAAVVAGTGWSWPLFVWGVALGPVAIVLTRFSEGIAARYVGVPADKADEVDRLFRDRRRTTEPNLVGMAIALGVAAGGLESVAIDVMFTGMVVVALGLPLLILPLVKRRGTRGT
jgi:hypothetical protein